MAELPQLLARPSAMRDVVLEMPSTELWSCIATATIAGARQKWGINSDSQLWRR
jgi:hypothetical protein